MENKSINRPKSPKDVVMDVGTKGVCEKSTTQKVSPSQKVNKRIISKKLMFILPIFFVIAIVSSLAVVFGVKRQEQIKPIEITTYDYLPLEIENGEIKSYNGKNDGSVVLEIPSKYIVAEDSTLLPYTEEVLQNDEQNLEFIEITSIAQNAFKDVKFFCLTIDMENIARVGESAFENAENVYLTNNQNGYVIADYAFKNSTMALENNVVYAKPNGGSASIGNEAFLGVKAFDYNLAKSQTNNQIALKAAATQISSATLVASETSGIIKLGSSSIGGISNIDFTDFYGTVYFGEQMARNNNTLTTVTLPKGASYIGDRAFEYASGLTTVNTQGDIVQLDNAAFANCYNLGSINLKFTSLKKINNSAFYNCSSLNDIKLPTRTQTIELWAFYNCAITSIDLSKSITTIEEYAFYSCGGLANITFSNSLTTIGEKAFDGCALNNVTLPASLTSLDKTAFGTRSMNYVVANSSNVYNLIASGAPFVASTYRVLASADNGTNSYLSSGFTKTTDGSYNVYTPKNNNLAFNTSYVPATVYGSPTINGSVVSGLSLNNYLQCSAATSGTAWLSANNWEINVRVTHRRYGSTQCIFNTRDNLQDVTWGLLLTTNRNDDGLTIWISSNGTSWDYLENNWGYTFCSLSNEDVVDVKITYDGSDTKVYYSKDGGINYTLGCTQSIKPYASSSDKFSFGRAWGGWNPTYNDGIDFSNTYCKVNGSLVWGNNIIPKSVDVGSTYGDLPTPTRSGYNFAGWNLLPQGYTAVEYIEGTGTQYINTGYVPNVNTYVEVDAKINAYLSTSSETSAIFGIDAPTRFHIDLAQNGKFHFGAGDNNSYANASFGDFQRHLFELRATGQCYIDGSNVANISSVQVTYTKTCTFFQKQIVGVSEMTKANLYSCKIYENNTLVRNFIPCMNPSGEYGLWDTVTNQFFGNSGTGSFIGGPAKNTTITSASFVELTGAHKLYAHWGNNSVTLNANGGTLSLLPQGYQVVDYIEIYEAQNQFIDTLFVPNQDTGIEITFKSNTYANDIVTFYGAGVNYHTRAFECYPWDNDFELNYGSSPNFDVPVASVNDIVTIKQIKNQYSVSYAGNTYTGSQTSNTFTAPYTLYIGTIHRAAGDMAMFNYTGIIKIYACKIWDNGKLIRNYVPCVRLSDNKPGLFDTITQTLFVNGGNGEFGYGTNSTLSEISYAVETGTPYGYLPTPTREGYSFGGWVGKNLIDIQSVVDYMQNIKSSDLSYDSQTDVLTVHPAWVFDGNTGYHIGYPLNLAPGRYTFSYTSWVDPSESFDSSKRYTAPMLTSNNDLQDGHVTNYAGDWTRQTYEVEYSYSFVATGTIYYLYFGYWNGGLVNVKNITLFNDDDLSVSYSDTVTYNTKQLYARWIPNSGTNSQYGYKVVEYIEIDGAQSQYIETNFVPNQDTSIEITFKQSSYANNDGSVYGGSANGTTSSAFECYPWNDKLQFNYGSQYNLTIVPIPSAEDIVTVRQNKGKFSVEYNNNVYSGELSSNTFTSPNSIYLGALHRNTPFYPSSVMKIYACKIWDNGSLVRNYIPVWSEEYQEYGLYDTVNNTFYRNDSGTGAFVGGPELYEY